MAASFALISAGTPPDTYTSYLSLPVVGALGLGAAGALAAGAGAPRSVDSSTSNFSSRRRAASCRAASGSLNAPTWTKYAPLALAFARRGAVGSFAATLRLGSGFFVEAAGFSFVGAAGFSCATAGGGAGSGFSATGGVIGGVTLGADGGGETGTGGGATGVDMPPGLDAVGGCGGCGFAHSSRYGTATAAATPRTTTTRIARNQSAEKIDRLPSSSKRSSSSRSP